MIWVFIFAFGVFGDLEKAGSQVITNVEPPRIVENTPVVRNVSITCHIEPDLHLKHLYLIQLLRWTTGDSNFIPVAQLKPGHLPEFVANAPLHLRRRWSVDGHTNTTNLTNNSIGLTINVTLVVPDDQGGYQCKLIYGALSSKLKTVTDSKNLTVVLPGKTNYSSGGRSIKPEDILLAVIFYLFLLKLTTIGV